MVKTKQANLWKSVTKILRGGLPAGARLARSYIKKIVFFLLFNALFVIVTFVRNAHNLFVLPFVVFCFDGFSFIFYELSYFYNKCYIGTKKSKKM